MLIERILKRAQVKACLGRDTRVLSSDGALDLVLKVPRERGPGGASENGTHAEHLFAAAYAAGFLDTIRVVARRDGIEVPADTEVEANIGIGTMRDVLGIEVELRVSLPGIPRAEADWLVEKSHAVCPYSNAVRDNAVVRLVLI